MQGHSKNKETGNARDSGTVGNGGFRVCYEREKEIASSLNKDDTGRVSGKNAQEQRTPVHIICFAQHRKVQLSANGGE